MQNQVSRCACIFSFSNRRCDYVVPVKSFDADACATFPRVRWCPGSCSDCLAGQSAPTGSSACTSCPAGSFSAPGSTIGCQTCSTGQFSPAMSGKCMFIPILIVAPTAILIRPVRLSPLPWTCVLHCLLLRSETCSSCAAGKTSFANRTGCVNCGVGTYSVLGSIAGCENCPTGRFGKERHI